MFCNKCGTQVSAGAAFCGKCGNACGGTSPPPNQARQGAAARGINKKLIIAAGAALILVVLIVVFVSGIAGGPGAPSGSSQEAERRAVAVTISAYAKAMSDMDFQKAAEFWIPRKRNIVDTGAALLDHIPYGGVLSSALPFIGSFGVFNYDILYEEISVSDDYATVNALIVMRATGIVDSEEYAVITLNKVDGAWLIESIQ